MKILAEQYEQALSVKIGDDKEVTYSTGSFFVSKFDDQNKERACISFDNDEFKSLILWGVQMLEEVK
jgi:hypothetical protein